MTSVSSLLLKRTIVDASNVTIIDLVSEDLEVGNTKGAIKAGVVDDQVGQVGQVGQVKAYDVYEDHDKKRARTASGGGKPKPSPRTNKAEGKLNKQQLKCIGKSPSFEILHSSYMHLHPPARPDDIFEDEEEQEYDEFVRIGKRNPNEKGTGRWKLTSKRNKLLILEFGNDESSLIKAAELKLYLEAFFQLEVDYYTLDKGCIDIANKCISLSGIPHLSTSSLTRPLRMLPFTVKEPKKKNKIKHILDVFSLFDSLAEVVSEPYLSCISLINHSLAEEFDDTVVEVMGRACGDRICCVSLPCHDSKREVIATSVHELLHTIGFDHCNSFRCVMNAVASADSTTLFLSPPNLRKMKHFHKFEEDSAAGREFLIKRYEDMLSVLKSFDSISLDEAFKHDCTWLEEKIKLTRLLFS